MSETEKQLVVFDWGVSSYFGWGVYGINLMLNWALRSDFAAVSAAQIAPADIVTGPLEAKVLEPLVKASQTLFERRRSWPEAIMNLPTMVLHSLGDDLAFSPGDKPVFGNPTIGVVFSQDSTLSPAGHERARRYPLIIAGSRWGQEILAANGVSNVTTILQGVDISYFHPAPKRGMFGDKFVVFSGGKLEKRKAQDLVVQAFRIFAASHRDAVLLTAWSSPWPRFAAMLNDNHELEPIRFVNGQIPDVGRWTRDNGIPQEQVFHLDAVPQSHMPQVLREADVALFPNRAEGGTNLVAMECMACGLPTILSANTGHLDLIEDQNCYPLLKQGYIGGASYSGWGESDVDEIVAMLELAYADRENASLRGRRGVRFISQFTWNNQMARLAETLHPYMVKAPVPSAAIA